MKRILLARPSLFIVNDMRQFITDLKYAPTPVKSMADLTQYPMDTVGGAVISTALNSEVADDYAEVAKQLKTEDPSIPIMLATLISFDKQINALKLRFEAQKIKANFYSIAEASRKLIINPTTDYLVITKDDISNNENYQTCKLTVAKFLR